MANEYGDIIRRMLRQLEEESNPTDAPRCEGCGRRVELAPYRRRMTDGGSEMLNFCGNCRALAMVELEDDNS
jgi:hypothetical protein